MKGFQVVVTPGKGYESPEWDEIRAETDRRIAEIMLAYVNPYWRGRAVPWRRADMTGMESPEAWR